MGRLRFRLVVLAGLVLVFLLAAASSAFAVPPAVTAVTPADGARFTGGFTVTFSATDPNGINGAGASVVVGTNTYTPTVYYSGYWDGDGCDSWWVEDRTGATFRCVVPDPGPGSHAVTIRVVDALGEAATKSLTVTRTAALTFAQQSPVPGGRYSAASDLFVLVSGAAISTSSASVSVDGVVVPAECEMVSAGVAAVRADHAFSAGSHTVSVSVGDGTSAPAASASWSFSVSSAASPPVVGPSQPADGSVVQGPFQLRYHVSDPNTVNGASARVSVLGKVYPAGVVYPGYWDGDACDTWWVEDRTQADLTFAIPDLPPGSHALRLEVADAAGDWVVKETTLLRSATLSAFGHTPADASRSASVGAVSVALTGATIAESSVSMTIDGASVPALFTPSADGGTVSYAGPMAEGTHAVRVTASDVFGSPAMSTEWSFVVDRTSPTVVSVSPSADSTMTLADAGIAVRLQDGDAIAPASVRLTLDGTAAVTPFVGDETGAWVRWNGILTEGSHEAALVARDLAGNEVAYAWSFVVADAPRFGAVSPSASVVSENTLLTAEVFDVNAEIDPQVTVTIDGDTIPAAFVSTGTRRGRIEATLSSLTDGAHSAVARVSDAAGNEASKAWTFTADAIGPRLESRTPATDAVLGNHTVSISGRFADASSIDPATGAAWLDGVPVAISSVNETRWEGEGCDAYEVVIPETLLLSGTFAMHDGPHAVRMTATDKFGHSTTEEWSFTVREYPKVSGVTPATGTHTKESSVTVSAVVGDFDGIASTTVEWRTAGAGEDSWQTIPSTLDPGTGRLTAPFTFPNGETGYEFRFSAQDTGGLTTTATAAVYVDADGPMIETGSLAPASGAVVTNHSVGFSGRFSDSSVIDVAATRAWIDGQVTTVNAAHDVRWVGEGCDAYEEELPKTLVFSGSAQLHDGPHTLRVQAGDEFGFLTTREWSFSVQEPPRIAAVTPMAGGRTTEAHVVASAKVTDFDGIDSATISWREANQGRPAGQWQTAETTYDIASGLLRTDFVFPRDDTRYEFRITATDSGGLTTTATTSVFASSSAGQLQASTDCTTCHSTIMQTHEMQNCYACHTTATGPCDCHGVGAHPTSYLASANLYDHGGEYVGRTCTDCHRHEADIEAQRHASGLGSKCSGCHEQALTAEHEGLTVNGSAFTCANCHESTDTRVLAAIAGSDTSCPACHVLASGHTELHRSPALRGTVQLFAGDHGGMDASMDVGCGLCHTVEDVSAIHGNECGACHPGPRDSVADWMGGCQEGECHPSIHSAAAAGHAAAEASESCSCHDDSTWQVSEASCGSCHALVDREAPVTTSDALPTYVGLATIHLNASDGPSPGGSGLAATYFRVDGGEQQAGTTVAVAAAPGDPSVHTVEFWSVDHAGNVESVKFLTFNFTIDATPPVTTSDARSSYIGPASIHLAGTDDSGAAPDTYYSLDGAATQQGTTVTVPQPSDGTESHTLQFWSVDASGNTEVRTTVGFTIEADATAPRTSSNAASFYKYGSSAAVTLTAEDPGGVGVESTFASVDGSEPTKAATISLAGLAAGPHVLEFWSVDGVGNTEDRNRFEFAIDGQAPVTTSDALSAYTTSAIIRLTASDGAGGSGVKTTYYRVDTQAQQQGTEVRVFTPGVHYVRFWSVDAVGNVESVKTVNFTLSSTDTIPPVTTSDVAETYVGVATINLTAVDNEGGSGVKATYYRLNGGPAAQGTTVLTDAKVSQVLEYWSVDNANNQESPHEIVSFSVTAPPGQGTIEFAWNAPPGAYINYYLYDSAGNLIDSTGNSLGWWGIHVPVSSQTYGLRAHWYDPETEESAVSYGSAMVDAEGLVVTWWY